MLDDIIQSAAAKKREALRAKYAAYRALLEKFNADNLSEEEGESLAAVIEELQISPADAQRHAESLIAHQRHLDKMATRPGLQAELTKLNPEISRLADERAAAIAKLDEVLNPLLYRAQEIERQLHMLAMIEDNKEREPGRYPALFGRGFDPEPVRHHPNAVQIERNTHLSDAWHRFQAIRKELVAGMSRAKLHDAVNDAITQIFRRSREPVQPGDWVPEGGFPNPSDFPPSARTDPRRANIFKRAAFARNAIKQGVRSNDFMSDLKRDLATGIHLGWIDGDYRELPDPDAPTEATLSA